MTSFAITNIHYTCTNVHTYIIFQTTTKKFNRLSSVRPVCQ